MKNATSTSIVARVVCGIALPRGMCNAPFPIRDGWKSCVNYMHHDTSRETISPVMHAMVARGQLRAVPHGMGYVMLCSVVDPHVFPIGGLRCGRDVAFSM